MLRRCLCPHSYCITWNTITKATKNNKDNCQWGSILSPNLLRSLANILGREVRLAMSSSKCLWIMKRIFVIKCKLKILLIIPFHVFVLLWSDECELEIKDWTNNMIYWIQHDIISTRHINTFLQCMCRKHY